MINTQDYILGAKEPKKSSPNPVAAQPNADEAPAITQGQLGPMPTVPVQPTQPKISTTPAPPKGGRQTSVGSVPITKVDYAQTEQPAPPKKTPDVTIGTVRQMDGTTDFDKAAEKYNSKAVAGYGDILDMMIEANRKPMTAEEKAAQEKRHKRDQLINSIGEGISALSNLYFTTKGAPNAYEPSNSLTRKAQERYEKLKAEREAEDAQTINLMLKKYGLDANLATAKAKQDLENQKFGFNVFNADRNFSQKGEIAQKNLDQKQQQIDNASAYNEGRLGETVRSNKANEGLRGKQIGEASRHNSVMESQGQQRINNGTGGMYSNGAKATKGNTILLNDGKVYSVPKSTEGALKGLASDMAHKAKAASDRYLKVKDMANYKHYKTISEKILSSPTSALAIVLENIHEFPTLDGKVRQIIGANGNGKSSSVRFTPEKTGRKPATKRPLSD